MANGGGKRKKMPNGEVTRINLSNGEVKFIMPNGEARVITPEYIDMIHHLIERCLPLYMSKNEVVSKLFADAKIENVFSEAVWEKMEKYNEEFFTAYHLRLMVKNHILRLNQLLERQAKLMQQVRHESQIHPMHNDSAYHAPHPSGPSIKPESNVQQSINPIANHVYNNNHNPCMQVPVNMGSHAGTRNGVAPSMLLNGGTVIKTEGGYAPDNSPTMFRADVQLLECCHRIEEVSISSFDGLESIPQALYWNALHPEMNSFGLLGQIPLGYSLPDFTPDFSYNVPATYYSIAPPHLGVDANFSHPHFSGEQQQEIKNLSGSFGYEDNGSSD